MKKNKILSWVLRILAAGLLLQTLYFKFSGAEESIYIFTEVGIEPWGRYSTGVAEAIAAILLLIPSTIAFGALMGAGIMAGAIASHFFILGIEVKDDGGQLFIYALIILVACIIVGWQNRQQLSFLFQKFKNKSTAPKSSLN